jgi:branched-chain amino acid transport system ATP-binding protein
VPVLEASGVYKRFGPVVALSGASLTVEHQQVAGLIGPNGSGKSTLLHCIAGRSLADSGVITLDGLEVTRARPARRARLGMSIKFQLARVYRRQTVLENVLLAVQAHQSMVGLLFSRSRRRLEADAYGLLDEFGLDEVTTRRGAELSHGQQQWLEIAMAMATRPKVLLLDEPTAGMSAQERKATGIRIRAAATRCAVLIVEHDLGFIRGLCDQITVLHEGKVVATGTPAQIEIDPRVQEVYLTRV